MLIGTEDTVYRTEDILVLKKKESIQYKGTTDSDLYNPESDLYTRYEIYVVLRDQDKQDRLCFETKEERDSVYSTLIRGLEEAEKQKEEAANRYIKVLEKLAAHTAEGGNK